MATDRPRTIGDAPACGPERSGGRRCRDFLVSRGMGASPGEASHSNGVAAQTIEAKPVFGQIKPSKRPRASACRTEIRRRRHGKSRLSEQELGTVCRSKKKNLPKGCTVSDGMIQRGAPLHRSYVSKRKIGSACQTVLRRGSRYFSPQARRCLDQRGRPLQSFQTDDGTKRYRSNVAGVCTRRGIGRLLLVIRDADPCNCWTEKTPRAHVPCPIFCCRPGAD